jgi:2-polyprenyl-3-methyl-5-hydroxy-6-metoxy-1,4-benzoquinol methylase
MNPQADFQALDKFYDNIDFLVPGYQRSSQYMVAIHQAFYTWAAGRVSGCRVLEAGSGEGFGAAILARRAREVVGIDIKPELILHARSRYLLPNLSFRQMDCERMDMEPGSFDVVVCNELIEHLPDFRAFLASAARVLRPGGRLICATTNRAISFRKGDGSPANRNHFQEFTAEEFAGLLKEYFGESEIYSQLMGDTSRRYFLSTRARSVERWLVGLNIKHRIPIRLRNRIRQMLTGVDAGVVANDEFEIVPGSQAEALYVIGVATAGEKEIGGS